MVERHVITTRSGVTIVPARSIEWIESDGNYVRIHAGRRVIRHRDTIRAWMTRLDSSQFMRVHCSFIVRLDVVRKLEAPSPGTLVLDDGTRLPVSRRYRRDIESRLLALAQPCQSKAQARQVSQTGGALLPDGRAHAEFTTPAGNKTQLER